MIQNYFKIAWRNLMKRKFYSLVSILGLSVGITFTLLIGTYIWGELQVNADLKNVDNQYLIKSKWKQADFGLEITTLAPLAKTLKVNYPNMVENYYGFEGYTSTISNGDKAFREDIQIGDATLLKMYGFQLLYGDRQTALDQPYSMVISSEQAIKYFGKLDCVGKSLTVESNAGSKKSFMISGVLGKVNTNSVMHLLSDTRIPILMSFESSKFWGIEKYFAWNNPYNVGFVELKKGVNPATVTQVMAKLIKANAPEKISTNLQAYLVPMKEVYLEANNSIVKKTILTLFFVALFILLMAIVNFINMSIGNAVTRLKEIGVRKMLGSQKKQLMLQFLAESILISLFSLLISLILYEVFQPFFGQMLHKKIPSLLSVSLYFYLFAILFSVLIGLISGVYPAFILSNLPSIDSLKGKLKSIKENIFLRRVLIVSQFSIALFVCVGASVINKQVNYFFNKDLGYQKEAVVTLSVPRDWSPQGVDKMERIRDEMAKLKEVSQVSLSYDIPAGHGGNNNAFYKMGQDSTQAVYVQTIATDEKYADTYQIPMIAGVYFQRAQERFQAGKIVLNETAIKTLGFKNPTEAIGQEIRIHYSTQPFTIVGVTKDFHIGSMHKAISPLVFMNVKDFTYFRYLSFKIQPSNLAQSLSSIEQKWITLMPGSAFEYTFIDDTLQKLYQSEIQLKKASQIATILSGIIVLLGILGMVSMSIARRTKELGIRKVLGASSISIIMLFLKEFVVLIAIAIVIAFPLGAMSMNNWLSAYAYRIDLSWQMFAIVAFGFSIIISLFVFLQTFKTALENPVKSLKTE